MKISMSVTELTKIFKETNRAVYNLTEGIYVLPFKNLTMGGQGYGGLRTLPSFVEEVRVWIFTVGGP